jgi:hypothetical protein
MLDRILHARARAGANAWDLIENTPAEFPRLVIAGKTVTGWQMLDMDATQVTASSVAMAEPQGQSRAPPSPSKSQ